MNHIVPIASRYESDAAGQGIQNRFARPAGGARTHWRPTIRICSKRYQGPHGRPSRTLTIENDRSAQEGQPHRKRTREGRSPTTTRWTVVLRGRSAATSTSSKRSSTTRCGRCPNIGNFCSSNRFRNFQSGCEDAAEMLPRRFFATDATGTAATQRTAADAGLRFRTPYISEPPRPRCARSTSRFPAPSASVKMSAVPPKPKKTDAACPCEETDGEFSGRPIRLFGIFSYICSNISGQCGRSRPRTAPRIENETP